MIHPMEGRIVVTGPSGFVGRQLVAYLCAKGLDAVLAGREEIGEVGPDTKWSKILRESDTVVHLAARAHVMTDKANDPLAAYRQVNTEGTRRLAEQCARLNVKRIVFLSSVKVLGEETSAGQPYNEKSLASPVDPYGISKWEAEQVLHDICGNSRLEFCILRPPLVYGPEVKANFLALIRAVDRGIPLPLGKVRNARSIIFSGNLVDAILTAASHPEAVAQTFLLSDGNPVATPDLIRAIAKELGKPARLISLSPRVLKTLGIAAGKQNTVHRLMSSLEVDSHKIRELLGWNPPFSFQHGIRETIKWYWRSS